MPPFAALFPHTTGAQVLVQATYQPIPCKCSDPHCAGYLIAPTLVVTTRLKWGELRMVIADTRPESEATQQQQERVILAGLAAFTQADANECLEILQSGYYQTISAQECEERTSELRTDLLGRAQAAINAAS